MHFALAIALLIAAPAKSPEARGRSVIHRVQKFYRHAKNFSAEFDQRYTYVSFGRTDESKGRVQVKRPRLLHWESEKPEKTVIILDGKDYWQYSPEDKQVVHKVGFVQDQLSSAFTFLWGKGDLLKDFGARAVESPEGLPKGDAVELLPKNPQPQVARLLFVVGKRGEVLASVVTNAQGDTNQLVFHDVKLNGSLPDSTFTFTPPPGASVQDLK